MTQPDAPGTEPPVPAAREAILYLPGLRLGLGGEKSKRGVATRLASALNSGAATRAATFPITWNDGAVRDTGGGTHVATISRQESGGTPAPVLDVYAYDWSQALATRWKAKSRLQRATRLAMSLLSVPSFVRFFTTSGKKNPTGRAQLVLAVVAAAVVAAYFVILLWALAQTAWQLKEKYLDDPPAPAASAPAAAGAEPSRTGDDGATSAQWITVLAAAAAAAMPNVRRHLTTTGSALGAAASYVRVAEGRSETMGDLQSYLEGIVETNDYERITVLGYSFGSILALDALYPTTAATTHTYDSVAQLVTIGSPYDFVVALKPDWRDGRHSRVGVPRNWLNIYSTIDLLGSNYLDAQGKEVTVVPTGTTDPAAQTPVRPTENLTWELGIRPSWTNLLELYGFASHGLYWGNDDQVDSNVFELVVDRVYSGHPALD